MRWVTFLAKLDRWAAWTTIIMIVLFVVTGYGMTKDIMDRDLARRLHSDIIPIPFFVALLIHGGLSLRHAMWRWKVFEKRSAADLFVLAVVLVLAALFMWLYWS